MKIHSGADAGTGYVHTITATAANVHDIAKAHELCLRAERQRVFCMTTG